MRKTIRNRCFAIGCKKVAPPRQLMCPYHWCMVPRSIQVTTLATYRPGNDEFVTAGDAAIRAVAIKEGRVCHAIGCEKAVPPKLLMCLRHWRMVPLGLRRCAWPPPHRPGQEMKECDPQPNADFLVDPAGAIRAVAVKEGHVAVDEWPSGAHQ